MPSNVATRIAARVVLALTVCWAAGAPAASGNPAAGEEKSATCAGCHGITGWRNAYPAYRVPKLGGQNAEYLVAALKAYQTKQRAHSTMQAIAATLSDEDIADLAAYFSARGGDQ
ncbi:MAG: c-type cytochrome [Sulfurifustaceae bacterium]